MRRRGFVVQQGRVGDGYGAGGGIDGETSAGIVDKGEGGRVAKIDVAGGDRTSCGTAGRVFCRRQPGCRQIMRVVVCTLNSDAQLGRARQLARILHRVGKRIRQGVSARPEGLDGCVVVVDSVGKGAIGVDGHRAVGSRDGCANRADGRAD